MAASLALLASFLLSAGIPGTSVAQSVTGTVPVGMDPRGICANDSTNRIYVANYFDGTVSVIDGGDDTVIATVPVGSAPQGICANDSTNRIYVANSGEGTVSVIDGESCAVAAVVPVASQPHSVAVNPRTKKAYVTDPPNNLVTVMRDAVPFSDEFSTDSLNPGWTWTDPLGDCAWSLTANPGYLRITVPDGGHDLDPDTNFNAPRLLQPVEGDLVAEARVIVDPQYKDSGAGILAWKDQQNFLRLERRYGEVVFWGVIGGIETLCARVETTAATVYLRLIRYGESFTAYYSENGYDWGERLDRFDMPVTEPVEIGLHVVNQEPTNPSFSADFDHFLVNEHLVTASITSGPGTVSPERQLVEDGADAEVAIIPAAGYHIAAVTDNGQPVTVTDPGGMTYLLEDVLVNHEIEAWFELNRYSVTASVASGQGSVAPPSQQVDHGQDAQPIEITADNGWHIAYVADNGAPVEVTDPSHMEYIIQGVDRDHSVEVTFEINVYNIWGSAPTGHGLVEPAHQKVNHGGSASITIVPDTGWYISRVVDNDVDVEITDPTFMQYVIEGVDSDHVVKATFDLCRYSIDAVVAGGEGTVEPASQQVNHGEDAAPIVITAAEGWFILEVTDNGNFVEVTDPFQMTYILKNVTKNHLVRATFRHLPFTVTASVLSGQGSVHPATQQVNQGEDASVAITPDAGWHIDSITDNGQPVPVTDPAGMTYTIFAVDQDHAVSVAFQSGFVFTVTARVVDGEGSAEPDLQYVVEGGEASVVIMPASGWKISGVFDNGMPIEVMDPYGMTYTISGVNCDHAVETGFRRDDVFFVTASVLSGQGTVVPAFQEVNIGGNASVTITPDAGWHIAWINDTGQEIPVTDPGGMTYEITDIINDHDVYVIFERNAFTVTAGVVSGQGTVMPPSQQVFQGDDASVTITPQDGWHIVSLSDNGEPVEVTDPSHMEYIIQGVDRDHLVEVAFEINTYTVNASVSYGQGTVEPASQQVAHGNSASIDINPSPGWHIVYIFDNDIQVGTTEHYVIDPVTCDHNVVVVFNPDFYNIYASVIAGNGKVEPEQMMCEYGYDLEILITPDPGWYISSIIDNGIPQHVFEPSGMTYVVRNITGDRYIEVAFKEGAALPTTWYLAEGCTGGDFETFILVQNPGTEEVTVDLILQTSTGEQRPALLQGQVIPAGSRRTFRLNDHITDWEVSTKVLAWGGGVICERAVYGGNRTWAHDSVGVTAPSTTWYLAEGCTGGYFETFILVQNPGEDEVTVDLVLQTSTGEQRPALLQGQVIPAGTRRTFKLNDHVTDWDVSTEVKATGDIICERAMYGGGRTWAHDSVGWTFLR